MTNKVPGRGPARQATTNSATQPALTESPIGLVRLRRYCELTGDTPQAVHDRRRKGVWVDGRHCFLTPGPRIWVDLFEVQSWIKNPTSRI